MDKMKIFEVHDEIQLKIESTKIFCHEVKKAIDRTGQAIVAIPGGSSIKYLFEGFNETDDLTKEEWNLVKFFWADERVVPPMDSQSNFKLALDSFIYKLQKKEKILAKNVYPFMGEEEIPQLQTENYSKELVSKGDIDILVLGVGPDGHIASLFPGSADLDNKERGYIYVGDSPKKPSERVTLSPYEIKAAKSIMLFFIGEQKVNAYEAFLDDKVDKNNCPAKLVLENLNRDIYVFRGIL